MSCRLGLGDIPGVSKTVNDNVGHRPTQQGSEAIITTVLIRDIIGEP